MIYKRIKTETIKIKDLFNKLGVKNEEGATKTIPFLLNVKTPYGFKRIITAFRTEKQKSVTCYFGNNKTLKTSLNHRLKVNGEWQYVKNINIKDVVETETGNTFLKEKKENSEEVLYDISVEEVHCYYSNGILSHNSWLLARLGAEAMKQGKNVIHYTLELNENYIGRRYDACFTGLDFQAIPKHKDLIRQKIDEMKSQPGFGKLKVKYFPIKTVSATSLKTHLERCQMLDDIKYDLMIVDYADILKPIFSDRNSNSYAEAGSIYEELRMIAGELQIPCWSASQGNRSSSEEDIITATNVADSYRKIMTADFVISLSRKMEDKVSNTARFHIIKNRFGGDGITLPSIFNSSNGSVIMYDQSSKEGIELQSKMSDGENVMKKMLSNKWQQYKENDEEDTEE